jgi:hypothetical protein
VSGGREHPRLAVAVLVRIDLPGGETLHGHTENLSCAGFQIRGGPQEVAALFAGSLQPVPRQRCEAAAELSTDDATRSLSASVRCAAVFARRVAENQFQMGFQFLSLSPEALSWIQARIATGLRQGSRIPGPLSDSFTPPES